MVRPAKETTIEDRFEAAPDFTAYLATVDKSRDPRHTLYDHVALDDRVHDEMKKLPPLHLLSLTEDWCGDAVNILPVVARMLEASIAVASKVLGRDEVGAPNHTVALQPEGTLSVRGPRRILSAFIHGADRRSSTHPTHRSS